MCIKLVLFHFSKICHENEIIYNLVTFHFHRIFKNGGGGGEGGGGEGVRYPLWIRHSSPVIIVHASSVFKGGVTPINDHFGFWCLV